MDRDCTVSMEAGTPYVRQRWRQVDDTVDADPEIVEHTVPQTKIAEKYYATCAAIDQRNRCRQDDLGIEK